MNDDSTIAATSSGTEPKYHTLYGLMYRIVAEYPDSEDGTREANQFMESYPGVGVLAVEDGRIILSHEDDPGAATDVDLVINRMKAAAKADRWGRSSESVGLTLIIVDVSRSGSFAWQIAGQRVKLAQVRALLEEAGAKGELPGAMPRND
ncbi:hypothetical protein [Pseudomonas aeruginosa]|uniref:hypothetical protein n=1 Tax=Pseudomonas aeruginosa TaxID=287 RepID=UPI000EB5E55D|nr:hypothetical protein [Pseudomonas aeruginosa]